MGLRYLLLILTSVNSCRNDIIIAMSKIEIEVGQTPKVTILPPDPEQVRAAQEFSDAKWQTRYLHSSLNAGGKVPERKKRYNGN